MTSKPYGERIHDRTSGWMRVTIGADSIQLVFNDSGEQLRVRLEPS